MTQTTVYVDGNTLSPQEVTMVADQRAKVAVSDDAWPRIHAATVSYTHLTLPTN